MDFGPGRIKISRNTRRGTRSARKHGSRLISVLQGVRRSDVVKLGPQMERWFNETLPNGRTAKVQKLVFTESKGRGQIVKAHALPILPPLRRSIGRGKEPNRTLGLFGDEMGTPALGERLCNWFKRWCREAGAPGTQRARVAKATRSVALKPERASMR